MVNKIVFQIVRELLRKIQVKRSQTILIQYSMID